MLPPHLLPLGLSFTTSLRRRGVSGTTRCSSSRSTQTSATGTNTSTGVQSYLEYCGNSPASGGSAPWGGGAWGPGAALQKGSYRKGTTESWGVLPPLSRLCCELDALEELSAEQLLLLHLPLLGGWQQSSLLLPLAASTQPQCLPGKQKPQNPPERRTTESHCCVVSFPREFLGVSEHEHHH